MVKATFQGRWRRNFVLLFQEKKFLFKKYWQPSRGRQRQALPAFLSLFGMAGKRPKGQRPCRCPWAAIPGVCLPVNRGRRSGGWLPVRAGNARALVLNAAQQQGFEALRQGAAPSANQQAELHSLWEKAPGYVPAHRGGWDEFPARPRRRRGAGCRRGRPAAGVFEVDAGRSHDSAGKGVCGGFVEYRPRQSLRILGRRGVSGHGRANVLCP